MSEAKRTSIVNKLLNQMAEKSNTVDLNAYAMGLEHMYAALNKVASSQPIIESYASDGIYLSVIPEAYKLNEVRSVCWRGIYEYEKDGKWVSDDCGCFKSRGECIKELIKDAEWVKHNSL